ncbi:MOSC domain-containing protein [Agromyces sp. SYSU T00266]|uniref:MOSC domain-containing protein n=1 Tax=Agromyces zhanjiangensis TaxID=3158562 RepID=UPI0033933317
MRVTRLRVHPVKSFAGRDVSSAVVRPWGLEGDEADAWLSARMRMPLRLVWQPDPLQRPVNTTHGGLPGDGLSLADAGPLLVASEASLTQLDDWTPDDVPPLDVVRFRPNVVIDGDEPFAEDSWGRVRIGDVRFRFGEVCDRCVVTTIDPVTLVRGKEPIRTLAKHRKWDGATWFGVRLIPELDGDGGADARSGARAGAPRIAVGDEVVVEAG